MSFPIRSCAALACFLLLSCSYEERTDWNNPVDATGDNFHPPVLAHLADTSFHVASEGMLTAVATSANSSIASYLWIVDGIASPTTSANLSTAAFTRGMHQVVLTVYDANGLSAADTANIWTGNHFPELKLLADTALSATDTLIATLDGNDLDGTIEKYLWSAREGMWTDSAAAGRIQLRSEGGGVDTVRWAAVDNEGAVSLDTFVVRFVPAPVITKFTDSVKVDVYGNRKVAWSAHIPDMQGETVLYKFYWGHTASDLSLVSSDSLYRTKGTDTTSQWQYRLVASNRFGDQVEKSGKVTFLFP